MMLRSAFTFAVTTLTSAFALAGGSVAVNAETAPTQILAGSRVAALADRIAHELVNGPDRSVASAYHVADQVLPAGEVRLAPGGSPFVSPTYVGVPIVIRVDGKVARTVMAGYRITTYVRTAVAARDLAPGAVIAEPDVTLARVAWNGRPAVGTENLIGRKLSGATPKGAPLYVEQTVPDTIVKPGQAAVLIVRDGPVSLTADVVARTGGALGDTVTVFNAQTQKAIAAVVIGRNLVELTLPGGPTP
jgi:flagella basal body P-ring formation protein FlgA